jgi:cation:H+ antiporter
VDISGALAIAILAVIAVLPEYAVDLYFSYTAGHDPGYVQYAAANMTGSNRLLLGLGWPVVVIIALKVASRRSGRGVRELVLHSGYRVELGFLLIASLVALVVPLSGQISLVLGFVLLGLFVFYLWKVAQASVSEPELVGAAARIGGLPARGRRLLVAGLFVFAAAVIVASAEPFASSLITTGTELGIDRFLLVQWVAPLASEAPEFIVAILFALHGKGGDAIGTLISSKVNQWTLLVGSLPVAYLAGGGGTGLVLDGRQVEEFLLTAAQTLLGIAALLALRFPRWLAFTLLGLFAVQYALPGQAAAMYCARSTAASPSPRWRATAATSCPRSPPVPPGSRSRAGRSCPRTGEPPVPAARRRNRGHERHGVRAPGTAAGVRQEPGPGGRGSRRRKEHADANAAAGPHPAHLRLRSATVRDDAPAAPRHALRAGPAAGAPAAPGQRGVPGARPGGDGRGASAGHVSPAPPRRDGAGQAERSHGLPGVAGRPRSRGPRRPAGTRPHGHRPLFRAPCQPGRAGQRADTRPPARRGMGHHLAARPRGRPRRAADTNRRPAAPSYGRTGLSWRP